MSERKKILIVDDEEDFVGLIKDRLEASGYAVISAADVLEGLEKARTEKPDLILLDVMMPKLDGYHMCRLLKFDDAFSHIPIILLTARAQERDQKLATGVGANDYMTKPFHNDALLKKIVEHLDE